ncbi:MAG: carboxypeptidase M32 [Parachlamydiaceae bacterium]
MKQSQKDYDNLYELGLHIQTLTGVSQLLEWDQETYMPPGAAGIRASQVETLSGIIHEAKTGKKFTALLDKLIDIKTGVVKGKGLSSEQNAALREWRRDYIKEKALPKKFVTELAKLTSQSILAWREAKQHNTFHTFAPYLKRLVELERKKAEFIGYQDHPYDALLDLYEPGATTKAVGTLFASLKKSINLLLKKIDSAKQVDDSFLHGKFSTDKQLAFSNKLLKDVGYNFDHGRLDISAHPFSSAPHPTDSRITTRIHPTSLINCISTVLHEVGHALYEMGLPTAHYGSPLGSAVSLGIHESQSRWWETRIGQSKAFWKHYLPLLKKEFPGKIDSASLDTFYKGVNKVEPSFIRVDADEVTYPLHVILRFELEKALIEGSLKAEDVPDAWNKKMKELLGVVPSKDSEGCLQDIHWAMGGFGYFPTYTLGNLYAAHLFEAFSKKHPDWEKRVAAGELRFITEWLHEAIHKHGRRYSSDELLKMATGKKFSADAYVRYLEKKYAEVYKL